MFEILPWIMAADSGENQGETLLLSWARTYWYGVLSMLSWMVSTLLRGREGIGVGGWIFSCDWCCWCVAHVYYACDMKFWRLSCRWCAEFASRLLWRNDDALWASHFVKEGVCREPRGGMADADTEILALFVDRLVYLLTIVEFTEHCSYSFVHACVRREWRNQQMEL